MTIQQQAKIWLFVLASILAIFWLFSSILLPFIAGMVVAYCLNPVTDKLTSRGLSRNLATSFAIFSFFILMVLIVLLLIPVLQAQVLGFIDRFPNYLIGIWALLLPPIVDVANSIGFNISESANATMKILTNDIVGFGFKLLSESWSGGLAVFNILTLLLITPVVAFYFLRDFDLIVSAILRCLPLQHSAKIRLVLLDIDNVMAGFLRGQGTVCLILGLFYGLSLTVAGLEFGLFIGIFSGLTSFIPFIGALLGLLLSLLTALTQFLSDGDYFRILTIVVIFLIGQLLEGYYLTPRILGNKIGLHPVWIMFSLLAGGALFGFVGVLVAVPVAAAFGVILRFVIKQYLESSLYLGRGEQPPDEFSQ